MDTIETFLTSRNQCEEMTSRQPSPHFCSLRLGFFFACRAKTALLLNYSRMQINQRHSVFQRTQRSHNTIIQTGVLQISSFLMCKGWRKRCAKSTCYNPQMSEELQWNPDCWRKLSRRWVANSERGETHRVVVHIYSPGKAQMGRWGECKCPSHDPIPWLDQVFSCSFSLRYGRSLAESNNRSQFFPFVAPGE